MERLRLRSVTGNRRSGSGDNTNVYRHWRPWRDPPPARPPPTGCSQRPSDNADQLAALVTSRLVITSTIRVSVNGSTLSSSAFGPSTDSTTIPGLGSTILVCLVAGSSGPAVGLSSISSHRTLNPNARSALPVAIASSGTIACFTLGRLWNLGGVVGPTVEGAPFFLGEPESTAGTLPRPLAQGRCESRSSWTTPTASKPGVQPLEELGTRAASREPEPGGVRGERGPGAHRARVQAQRAPVAAGVLPVPVLRLGRLGDRCASSGDGWASRASSSHNPSSGTTCARPCGRLVAIQYCVARSSSARTVAHASFLVARPYSFGRSSSSAVGVIRLLSVPLRWLPRTCPSTRRSRLR